MFGAGIFTLRNPFIFCKHICLQYLGYSGDWDDAGSGEITRGVGESAG